MLYSLTFLFLLPNTRDGKLISFLSFLYFLFFVPNFVSKYHSNQKKKMTSVEFDCWSQ